MEAGEVAVLRQRVQAIEATLETLGKEVGALQSQSNMVAGDIMLIRNDMEHTKKSIDEIKADIKLLTGAQINDHYVIPLTRKEKREEAILTLARNIFYGGLLIYTLSRLFPMIHW